MFSSNIIKEESERQKAAQLAAQRKKADAIHKANTVKAITTETPVGSLGMYKRKPQQQSFQPSLAVVVEEDETPKIQN